MTFEPIAGTLVIGLGHRARHGKDSVAQFMIEAAPADVMRFAFADALYDYCRIEHGMTTKDGPLLQRVGVEMRGRDPLVWVRAVYYKILEKKPKVAVLTDVRFPNEADFVRQMNGYTVRVQRSHPDGVLYQANDRDPFHISEIALTDDRHWYLTIHNYQGLDELRRKAEFALDYLWRKGADDVRTR